MSEYRVLEGAGYIAVCVRVIGDRVTQDGLVRVVTEDGTATGKYTSHCMIGRLNMNIISFR